MSELDIEVRAAITLIRELDSELSDWTEENQGEVDDEEWFDTIAEFKEMSAGSGIHLASLVSRLLPPNTEV